MRSKDIRQIKICKEKVIPINEGYYILDFGCGDGHRVYQLLNFGFKHSFGFNRGNYRENSQKVANVQDNQLFRFSDDGIIPFPNEYFDLIISDYVFEHVFEQEKAFYEIHRVLKPGGVSVHVMPAKWQIIEPHIYVPFGGLFKTYYYYYFWALFGIRNKFQKSLAAKEVAKRNLKYARENLNYISCRDYQKMMSELGFQHSWEELAYMKTSYKTNIQKLAKISENFPLILSLIRTFYQRVLFLQK